MVKQGRFAKSSKLKQIKQIRRRLHHQPGRVIGPEQFQNFVLVRYGLTLKKKYRHSDKETMQRFLIELLGVAGAGPTWPMATLVTKTFSQIGIRVPYQFYRQVLKNWESFNHFLEREIPAVPLKERISLIDLASTADVEQIILRQLAANTLFSTGNPQLIKLMRPAQLDFLVANLSSDQAIDWQKVKAVFEPIGFDTTTAPDSATQQWLNELKEL